MSRMVSAEDNNQKVQLKTYIMNKHLESVLEQMVCVYGYLPLCLQYSL